MDKFRKESVVAWGLVGGVIAGIGVFVAYDFASPTEKVELKTVQVVPADVTVKPTSKCCVTKNVTVCHELKSISEPESRPFTHCTKGIELVECKDPVLNQNGEKFCLQKIYH